MMSKKRKKKRIKRKDKNGDGSYWFGAILDGLADLFELIADILSSFLK